MGPESIGVRSFRSLVISIQSRFDTNWSRFGTPYVFSPRIWEELQFSDSCACANKIPKQQYLWTWRQSVVPNDAPRDFGPEVAFGAKFQIPIAEFNSNLKISGGGGLEPPAFPPATGLKNWVESNRLSTCIESTSTMSRNDFNLCLINLSRNDFLSKRP